MPLHCLGAALNLPQTGLIVRGTCTKVNLFRGNRAWDDGCGQLTWRWPYIIAASRVW